MTDKHKERIESAIGAHVKWLARLREAVSTGKSEFSPGVVRLDDQCEFGKWVLGDFKGLCPAAVFDSVKRTHAEFHRTAGEVLEMALHGRTDAAAAELRPGAKLSMLSGQLILSLRSLS